LEIRSKEWIEQDEELFRKAAKIFVNQYSKLSEEDRKKWAESSANLLRLFDEGMCGFIHMKRLHEVEILVHKKHHGVSDRTLRKKRKPVRSA
jgi:hypothetical protein